MRISGHVTHRLRVKRELLAHIKLIYDQAASVCLKLGHTKKHTHTALFVQIHRPKYRS